MRRWLPALMTAVAAAILAPAAHGFISGSSSFELETADGWHATVHAAGYRVNVTLYRGGVSATYATDGVSGRGGMAADFEAFGDIYTNFAAEGEQVVRRIRDRNCRGKVTIRRGTFTGQIELIPEGAFTHLSATSARGRVFTTELRCEPPEPPSAPWEGVDDGTNATVLDAHHRRRNRGPYFEAQDRDGRPQTSFIAGESHTVGDVEINNSASVRASRRAFRYDLERGTARVAPPEPFSGTASFVRRPDGGSRWRGDLAVTMPAGELRLTGREFRASLRRTSSLSLGF